MTITNETKEFFLFVPGIGAREPEMYLNKLVEGIRSYCKDNRLSFEELDNKSIEGTGQRKIKIQLSNNQTKIMDIQEIYWTDLCPLLSSESGWTQVIRGLDLLIYWISSKKLWKQIKSSQYILFTFIITLIVSLAWYYGVLAAVFTAVGANSEVLGVALPSEIAKFFADIGNRIGGWYIWGITSVIVAFLPVQTIIDISYGSKCYLENYQQIFRKIYSRVNQALQTKIESSDYDRITIISHSFGVVISTEVLANYIKEDAPDIRNITMGGALLITTARSKRVKEALQKVLNNEKVKYWVDFYSYNDWLCTISPIPQNDKNYKQFRGKEIKTAVSLDERLTGVSHDLYFNDWDVIKTLLENKDY